MTNLQKAEAVVQQLQNKAQELLQAEVWDNKAIEANARMLSRFTSIATKEGVEDYLNKILMRWSDEQKATDVPFKLELWDDRKRMAFDHSYPCSATDLIGSEYLPQGWRTWLPEEPLTLKHLDEALEVDFDGHLYSAEDLLKADIHSEEREVLRIVLLELGYLTNQQNITGTAADIDNAFSQLQKALGELTTPETNFKAIVTKLEVSAKELVNAEVWDEPRIQFVAGLRYIYQDFVSANEERIELYIKTCSGNVNHYLEHQPVDAINDAEVWKGIIDDLIGDAQHFYQGMLDNYEQFPQYLPKGWTAIRFRQFDWEFKPQVGNELLDHIADFEMEIDEIISADVLGEDREYCGQVMVLAGYLTNQENLTGEEVTVLKAFKQFGKELEKALENE